MNKHTKILLLILALFITTTSYSQVIKLATIAPEGSPWHVALKELAADWRKISNGTIKVRIYPGGIAGDEPDLIRKMRIGQLHAAALTSSGLSYLSKEITAITFPMNMTTDAELDYVLNAVGGNVKKEISQKGFEVLSWSNSGWVHFFSKKPVVTPADLRAQKLFFWGSRTVYIELLKKTGFKPVPLSVTDLLPSLQTGLVEAFASPPQAALAFQWYSQAPNMSGFRWQPLPSAVVISNRKWRQLPAKLKPHLLKSAVKVSQKLQKKLIEMEQSAVQAMKKRGLKVAPAPETAIQEWKKLVMTKGLPVFLKKCFSREMFDKVEQALRDYRKNHSQIGQTQSTQQANQQVQN